MQNQQKHVEGDENTSYNLVELLPILSYINLLNILSNQALTASFLKNSGPTHFLQILGAHITYIIIKSHHSNASVKICSSCLGTPVVPYLDNLAHFAGSLGPNCSFWHLGVTA